MYQEDGFTVCLKERELCFRSRGDRAGIESDSGKKNDRKKKGTTTEGPGLRTVRPRADRKNCAPRAKRGRENWERKNGTSAQLDG